MVARLLCLRVLDWDLWDDEKKDLALRQRLREDFACTLHSRPSSLETASLHVSECLTNDVF